MDNPTLGVIFAAGGGLATAIGVLWKWVIDSHRALEDKLATCEKKHSEADNYNRNLELKIAQMEGQMGGFLAAKRSLKELSDTVLKMLENQNTSG